MVSWGPGSSCVGAPALLLLCFSNPALSVVFICIPFPGQGPGFSFLSYLRPGP